MVKKLLKRIKKGFSTPKEDVVDEDEYVEITGGPAAGSSKVTVRPFILEDFSDVKQIVDSIRQGYTIALVNIAPLKEKDLVELKRAISKLKKTVDAVEGDIAGFSDDYIVVVPSFAEIYRSSRNPGKENLDT